MMIPSRARRSATVVAAALLLGAAACSSGSSGTAASTTTKASPATTSASAPVSLTPTQVASNAFVAGYPLVISERTMEFFAGLTGGVNRLFWSPGLTTASTRLIPSPNHDTVYSIAVLDLSDGPVVLSTPAIHSRYFTFQFIDAWMYTLANVGTRATDGDAGSWAVVPAGWHGALPAGMHAIQSDTDHVLILGRVRAIDDADATRALTLKGQISLQPLAAIEHPGTAVPTTPPMPKALGLPQATGTNGIAYFDELGTDLATDPPVTAAAKAAIDAAATLGVGPGKQPSAQPSAADRSALTAGVTAGYALVKSTEGLPTQEVDGWHVNLGLGSTHSTLSLLDWARVAKHFWGPNVGAESVYAQATTSIDGARLTGKKSYVIHIAADDIPPVKAFWSYTVYSPDNFFFANPLDRYSLSGQTPGLVTNADGSIDIYLGTTAPAGHESNWIPTPARRFTVIMRLYLSDQSVLDGHYNYPEITVQS